MPDDGSLALRLDAGGTLRLTDDDPHDGLLRLRGELPTVTVLDDRGGSSTGGWTVSGRFTPLEPEESSTAAPDGAPPPSLVAEVIGWLPHLVTSGTGLTAGPGVATGPAGGTGLAQPALLASASADYQGPVTELGASVVLDAPGDAAPGRYHGTVTLTLFPVEDGADGTDAPAD